MKINDLLITLRETVRTEAWYREIIERQLASIRRETARPGIVQEHDTNEWWHISEGRIGRAAFLIALTGDAALIEWTHDAVMWVTRQDADAWIGPFFRRRTNPLSGTLETAHLCRTLTTALLFCPEIFTPDEIAEMHESLRTKGIAAIDHWLAPFIADPTRPRNNWCIIELGGAMSAAAVLGDIDKLRSYIPLFNELHEDYNEEFYGEPMGYWSYAVTGFLAARFFTDLVFPELADEMADVQIIINPFIWAYYRRQGMFLLQNIDRYEMRSFTFGDCSTKIDISPLTVLYTAVHHKDPKVRALASAWYKDAWFSEGSVSMETLALLPQCEFKQKDESFLPPSRYFGDGYLAYKDAWENPAIQIAVQTGVAEAPKCTSHRHADHLSFQLAKDGIVILDDPSRCCYRLHTQKLSEGAGWHSVPSFTTADGRTLSQKVLHAADYKAGNYDKLEHVKLADGAFTASSEASGVYPEEITMLRRTFAGAGENVLVIMDEYEASEPVRETASFVGNNRRREMKWTLTANGGVLTREGVGVSIHALQPVMSELDYAALHDSYSITPDSMLQGREGSGYIVRVRNAEAAVSGRSFYVIFADKADALGRWAAALDGDTVTVTLDGAVRYTFDFADGVKIFENGRDLLA